MYIKLFPGDTVTLASVAMLLAIWSDPWGGGEGLRTSTPGFNIQACHSPAVVA